MRSNQDRTILALWLLCRASLVMYLIGIIVTIIIYTVNKIYNGDNDPSYWGYVTSLVLVDP